MFLPSPRSGFTTGTAIKMDGGFSNMMGDLTAKPGGRRAYADNYLKSRNSPSGPTRRASTSPRTSSGRMLIPPSEHLMPLRCGEHTLRRDARNGMNPVRGQLFPQRRPSGNLTTHAICAQKYLCKNISHEHLTSAILRLCPQPDCSGPTYLSSFSQHAWRCSRVVLEQSHPHTISPRRSTLTLPHEQQRTW